MAIGRTRTKGTGIKSWSTYIETKYGAGTMSKLLADLPPELRGIYPNVLTSEWYPVEFAGFAFTAMAKTLVPDPREQTKFFDEIGRVIAQDNLNSIYRFVLSMMSPDRVLGMTPRLWTTYFEGVEVTVTPGENRSGKVVVQGLEGLPYIGPVACGWLTLAYELCGAKVATVTEENWLAGRASSNRLVFDHRWR